MDRSNSVCATSKSDDKSKRIQRKTKEMANTFGTPITDPWLKDYSCCLIVKSINRHGRMYLTLQNLCFHSYMGPIVKVIPWKDVISIEKDTHAMINPAITIKTADKKYLFCSFSSRSKTLEYLIQVFHGDLPKSDDSNNNNASHDDPPTTNATIRDISTSELSDDDDFSNSAGISHSMNGIFAHGGAARRVPSNPSLRIGGKKGASSSASSSFYEMELGNATPTYTEDEEEIALCLMGGYRPYDRHVKMYQSSVPKV
eukprot:TRINITY_DN11026_c0_g1_i1.p1 TRINITY_DN11026_c0_g1~~TRINITY_DN11026_c0_g1_i1.p1  ORF type:complete len:268 (+),score=72.68 TRINITY_DN11026_c0_g1_i1:36-806(+)